MADDRIHDELHSEFDKALRELKRIWEDIGIHNEKQEHRKSMILHHVKNLFHDMIGEEENLRKRLAENVERFTAKLESLSKELRLPLYQPEGGLNLLQLEKTLKNKVIGLKAERNERTSQLQELKQVDQHLCDALCSTPYYIPSNTIPSREQLDALKEHIRSLEEEKERRKAVFSTTRKSIVKLMDELDTCPNTTFERDVVCEEEDSFLLSTDNIKAIQLLHTELEERTREQYTLANDLREQLTTLWRRLNLPKEEQEAFSENHVGFKPKTIQALKDEIARCNVLRAQNLKSILHATRQDLVEWWDKCYYSPDQRDAFTPFFSDDVTEEVLELHDTEIVKVKNFYRDNHEMLEKVDRWQHLWREHQHLEEQANDPNRFFNRNWNSLKEEKIRKKVQRELPKVEQSVKEQIQLWEEETGRVFLIGGVPFVDYIRNQWDSYNFKKEQEKKQKQKDKLKQTEDEMHYGSKPVVTPNKRRLGATPGRTPNNKMRKLGDTTTPRTPASVSRLGSVRGGNSIFASPAHLGHSVSRPKTPLGKKRVHPATTNKRNPLGDHNTIDSSIFSQTTVSGKSGPSTQDEASIAAVGLYNEFAVSIQKNGSTASLDGPANSTIISNTGSQKNHTTTSVNSSSHSNYARV